MVGTATSSSFVPKPLWVGTDAGGPPLSRQQKTSEEDEPFSSDHSTVTVPPGRLKAPCLTAFVASSCRISANLRRCATLRSSGLRRALNHRRQGSRLHADQK